MDASAPPKIKVVIADDHRLVRSGLRALLESGAGVEVVAEAADGCELLDKVAQCQPDIVFTDLSMPVLDGFEATRQIRQRHPLVHVVALTMHSSPETVKRAVAAGVCGYVLKDSRPFELEQAVRSVMARGRYFSSAIAQRLLQASEPQPGEELTPRQLQILQLIAQSHRAKEIGHMLGLSPRTVDVHRGRLMRRLNLNDVASLTRYALRKGLVSLNGDEAPGALPDPGLQSGLSSRA